MQTEARRERWEQRTDLPLLVAALLFLAVFAWPVLDPGLSAGWRTVCLVVSVLTWVLFVLDYVVRVVLSRDRWRFVRRHPLDLLIVVLPVFRPLALLRLLPMLGVLNRRAQHALHGRVALYIGSASLLLVTVSALLMLQVERGRPGAVIEDYGDALWWAMTTVTTVGYGDTYPTTTAGRWVAGVLMTYGIALIGLVTATSASWLVQQVAEEEEKVDLATQRDVESLTREVSLLRDELSRLRGTAALDPGELDSDTPGGVI